AAHGLLHVGRIGAAAAGLAGGRALRRRILGREGQAAVVAHYAVELVQAALVGGLQIGGARRVAVLDAVGGHGQGVVVLGGFDAGQDLVGVEVFGGVIDGRCWLGGLGLCGVAGSVHADVGDVAGRSLRSGVGLGRLFGCGLGAQALDIHLDRAVGSGRGVDDVLGLLDG